MQDDKWSGDQIFTGDGKRYGVAYIMTNSKVKYKRRHSIAFVFLIILLGSCIVYGLGSLAYNFVVVAGLFGGTDNLTLKSATYYAVSVGEFTSLDVASNEATQIKQQKGAGYIYNNGEVFVILLQIYSSEADATSVIAKLANTGVTGHIVPLQINKKSYGSSLSEEDSEVISNMLVIFDSLYERLYELSVAFDTQEKTQPAVQTEIITISEQFNICYTRFLETFSHNTESDIMSLRLRLETVREELTLITDPLVMEETFGSHIKHAICSVVISRKTC